mmetsp:Transcript_10793/g.33048  ORF Transcript_10793/g.33048 Transcript_10793/m.33048 type:complete len:250 (-) Transcript_10793:721-1470(-)
MAVFAAAFISAVPGRCNVAGQRLAVCTRNSGRSRMALDVAVLISGGGRSLENIFERIESGELADVKVKCVVASKASAGGLRRAEARGIPTRVLPVKDFESVDKFSEAITSTLDEFVVDLAVLAGWMHFYKIPKKYATKVVNIHPSLIPAFCGKGYYGNRVHEAVLQFGAKLTGCTVHFADNEYDHGPIIMQLPVPVAEDDDADSLAARVFEREKEALPKALQLIAEGRVQIDGRRVRILPAHATKKSSL